VDLRKCLENLKSCRIIMLDMIINKVKLEMIYVGRKTLVRLALVYVFKICCICLNVKEVKNE